VNGCAEPEVLLIMKRLSRTWLLLIVVTGAPSCRQSTAVREDVAAAAPPRGSLIGHVHLIGPPPANDALRMAADPMCKRATDGKRVLDNAVLVAPDGALANVFVQLVGEFPETPVPVEPASIDQRACVYRPRVLAIRAGQALQIRNSDDGLHNVHGVSTERDSFNVGQPVSNMVNTVHPRDAGILRLKCDVHAWMVAFVGVVNHPYFAVTDGTGTFLLRDVPIGTYTLRAWHERFGTLILEASIEPNHEATVEMKYAAESAR
jgi:plastocyanin